MWFATCRRIRVLVLLAGFPLVAGAADAQKQVKDLVKTLTK